MLKHLILFIFIILLPITDTLAKVTASTGRTVLSIDESIILQLKSSDNSDDPDLSVLENDFKIINKSQSKNFSFINGKTSSTHTWSISLLAKNTGEISIPAIIVGDESTKPIHLIIRQPSTTPGIDGKEAFLKVSIVDNEENEFYVQQQILLKVQLFHRVRFTNASLSELELTNTVIEKLGEDNNYNKVISKHRYNIVERTYAIYPQQSGELIIPPIVFNGNIEVRQNYSLFSQPGRQIASRTKPLTLNILPIPEDYSGKNWLPAESLVIESEILEDPSNIVSGEAITRHIVVRATGLLGSQLPALSVPSSKSIKSYPDKEQLNSQLVNGKVVGSRRDTIAIIPLREGLFTLPEIKINWWNVKTRQVETAILEAKTLVAQNNPDIQAEPVSPPIEATKPDTTNGTADKSSINTITETIEKIVYKPVALTKNIWFWISIGLLISWLITLILLIMALSKSKSKKTNSTQQKSKSSKEEHDQLLKSLQVYCQNNDAHNSSDALVYWAQFYFNKPSLNGLSQIIELILDEPLINAINTLESSQYSANKQDWSGSNLSSAVINFIKQDRLNKQSHKQHQFTPLNP
ncbi:MAG: protein BatD [Proteobacteria bacterium]|nr:protein BatD [Pseudomonadota bacterium]